MENLSEAARAVITSLQALPEAPELQRANIVIIGVSHFNTTPQVSGLRMCKFIPPSKHDKKVSHVVGGVSNGKGPGLVNVALAYVTQKALYVFSLVGRKIEPLQGSMTGLAVTG
ncbi:uncharacterized protein Aud_006714 [Aspergillus udagawae]|uniref:Uncharacterized protein n=1 Tax=Aspergillus udagawae TaxID=91492 RepID=A0A8E0V1R7_9EURO|nr:uncharacterized protein Aud_006714 [Aspergillus udagawae]GIC90280.1 hypothetical protein Aud_006714 [Aspergillus udagawae]